jgi:hypothetical protein
MFDRVGDQENSLNFIAPVLHQERAVFIAQLRIPLCGKVISRFTWMQPNHECVGTDLTQERVPLKLANHMPYMVGR